MHLISQIKDAIRTNYVLVEEVDRVIAALDSSADVYTGIDDPHQLAETLTRVLRDITADKHFAVVFTPPGTESAQQAGYDWAAVDRRNNYYFHAVNYLAGNVGYLDFRVFFDAGVAGETAIGAMAFLANTDALIFDLRRNRGGVPSMIQLLQSYLFSEPTHINTFYNRVSDEYTQSWTMPYVPGKKMADVPVYVLISPLTGSAAEEFAYNIQQLERGTLVGQTTAGAGHISTRVPLDAGFSVNVPSGRPINPISGTGWEGVGIHPHIETSVEDALYVAHTHALETLIESADDADLRAYRQWELETVQAQRDPYPVADLARYVGNYDDRRVWLDNGVLTYQYIAMPEPMLPVAEHTFVLMDDMRATFNDDTMLLTWRDSPRQVTCRKMPL